MVLEKSYVSSVIVVNETGRLQHLLDIPQQNS